MWAPPLWLCSTRMGSSAPRKIVITMRFRTGVDRLMAELHDPQQPTEPTLQPIVLEPHLDAPTILVLFTDTRIGSFADEITDLIAARGYRARIQMYGIS